MPQLRAALYDIHDIFFVLPLGDRLALLQQDRELRAERKLRGMVLADCLDHIKWQRKNEKQGFNFCPLSRNLIWICSLFMVSIRRRPNVPRREWSCPPPHRDLWTGRNGMPGLTGFKVILNLFKVIGRDVSDAPSGWLTLPHRPGRCSRSQRAPQQTGGCKLHIQLLFLAFYSRGKKGLFFSSQSQVQPNLTPDRPTQPARVRFFTPRLSTVLAPLILTQLSKEIIKNSHILMLSLCSQELVPKNSGGESEAREPEKAALFGLNLSWCVNRTLWPHISNMSTLCC